MANLSVSLLKKPPRILPLLYGLHARLKCRLTCHTESSADAFRKYLKSLSVIYLSLNVNAVKRV